MNVKRITPGQFLLILKNQYACDLEFDDLTKAQFHYILNDNPTGLIECINTFNRTCEDVLIKLTHLYINSDEQYNFNLVRSLATKCLTSNSGKLQRYGVLLLEKFNSYPEVEEFSSRFLPAYMKGNFFDLK